MLAIAAAVARGGRAVTAEHVAQARAAGAADVEIHDTVLIAAMFCMFNRYVDGLATITPDDPAVYAAGAQRLVTHGYVAHRLTLVAKANHSAWPGRPRLDGQ